MFSKDLLRSLAKFLGIFIIIAAAIFFISGFFVAFSQGRDAGEAIGSFLGYELAGFAMLSLLYLVIGTLARWNELN